MSIVIDKLNVSFDGKPVLRDFCLDIPLSGVSCFFGPSGCGKSTLFKCMAGLIAPQSGTIEGREDKKLSVVFQEHRLLPWSSALDNVALVVVGDRQRASKLLHQVGLAAETDKLPAELSGGMQRRVAIARALAYGGDILLLDEPTAGLDEALATRIMDDICAAWRGRCLLLITHEWALAARYADRIYKLAGPPLTLSGLELSTPGGGSI